MQEVIISIDNTAAVKVTAKGIKGKACRDVTAAVEKALGATVSSTPTPEMHQAEIKQGRGVKR